MENDGSVPSHLVVGPGLIETVAPPREPLPPTPPQPRTRKARWSSLENEILRSVILPKLRAVHAAARPTTIVEFLDSWRTAHEPELPQSEFEGYLDALGIKVRRITVFEGLEPPEPAPQPLQARAIPFESPPFEFVRTPRAPEPRRDDDDDNGSFDNEGPEEFSPMDADPFLPQEDAERFLNSLGPDPEAFNQ